MNKKALKAILPYCFAIISFFIFGFLYCSPLFKGKVLQSGDVDAYIGASQEISEYTKSEGRQIWWTNSMFGGMPSYQISGNTPSGELRLKMEKAVLFGFLGSEARPAEIIISYLIGFFILLICFEVNPWLSIAGAFALTLSSYFMLIIPAGHMSKAGAICCLAPFVGGIHAVFRKRFRLGVPLVLLYGTTGIALHPQMSYYFAMLIGVLCISELNTRIAERKIKDFGISAAVLAICLALVFGTKLSWCEINRSYLAETMRSGQSELKQTDKPANKNAGLDFDYATAYSYGKNETLTLLIPNYMGGSSDYNLGNGSALEKELTDMGFPLTQAREFCHRAPTYWGEKEFTNGPVYVGAIICFLFILGLIIVPGAMKWGLLIATLFSISLAWGHNLPWLSRFFFDHFPMYSKFRTVESILIVAEITIPLLGFLAVKRLVESNTDASLRKNILIAGGITCAICLFVSLFGGGFDAASSFDAQWNGQFSKEFYLAVLNQRYAMMKASAWRSLLFVILAVLTLLVFIRIKDKSNNSVIPFAAILLFLTLFDMVPVNRDFFGKQNFVSKKQNDSTFDVRTWEEEILQDKTPNFRVFKASYDSFNESRTSYRFKSIGGYSAAKLRRYQDLIDAHLSQYNNNVLNMLNTKYIVDLNETVHINPTAFGNAWFVDNLLFVDTPDEESAFLNVIDLKTSAVADKKFSSVLNVRASAPDESARIVLDSYVPDRLSYTSECSVDKIAVFSEIYYPEGWHLYVDGKETEIGRVNYTLRAAVIPAGKHTVKMEFVPEALKVDRVCTVFYILAILLSLGVIICPKGRIAFTSKSSIK